MKNISLYTNYAKALLNLTKKNNVLDDVFNDVQFVHNVLLENDNLVKVLQIPLIPKNSKKEILQEILKKRIKTIEFNDFLNLIADKNKIQFVLEILNSFITIYHKEKGFEYIEIISTKKLSEKIIKDIISKINLMESKTIIKENIDKSLKGGFVLKYNGRIYDASIKQKLNNIRKNINI